MEGTNPLQSSEAHSFMSQDVPKGQFCRFRARMVHSVVDGWVYTGVL